MILQLIAMTPLSENYQKIIATVGCEHTRKILANSSNTSVNVINSLLNDKNHIVRTHALRFTNDSDVLETSLGATERKTLAVLKNHNLPIGLGEKYLTSNNPEIRLAGFINPNVSLEEKQKLLTSESASFMVDKGGCLGDRVVKAHALVEANPTMVTSPTSWDLHIQRAILGMDNLNLETLAKLQKRISNKKYNHLKFLVENKHQLSLHELARTGNPMSDLHLVKHPELTIGLAKVMLKGDRPYPEPHIIAKLVQRFNTGVLLNAGFISDTRIRTAAFLAPEVTYYNWLRGFKEHILEIPDILGENLMHWDNFNKLSVNWEKSAVELAHVAVSLAK